MSMTGISASENVDQTDSLGLSIEDNIETAEDELKIIRQTPGEVELKENENQTMNSNILGISNEDEILGAKDIYVKGDTFEDIQNAINGAETGDIIHLNGTYTNNLVKRIEINKNISIIGKDNATLDAEGQSSIFYVNSSKINIQDITFKNGNVRFIHPYLEIRSGGAIFLQMLFLIPILMLRSLTTKQYRMVEQSILMERFQIQMLWEYIPTTQ